MSHFTRLLSLCLAVLLVTVPVDAQSYYQHGGYYHFYRHYSDAQTDDSTTGTALSGTTSSDLASTTSTDLANNTTSIASTSASALATTSSATSGPPVSGMALTFDDEFNSLSASSSGKGELWETKFFYNSLTKSNWDNLDLSPDVCGLGITPYAINNGILHIHEQKTDPRLTACGVSSPYTSGNLNSYYSFSQTYGYFEVRMQVSGEQGATSTFWMLPKDGSWPPEIDITETLGREPNIDNASNHTTPSNTTMSFPVNAGGSLANGFHTYGLLWSSDSLTYFLDGMPVAKTPTGTDEHKPFFMIVGLGVGSCGGWVGCPASNFSGDVYVDYVRVWQYADQSPGACVGDC